MNSVVYKPPMKVPSYDGSVFLAGTIDNGDSEDWQVEVEKSLADLNVSILNPRRDDWDTSLEQTAENEAFKEQVTWELDGLQGVDIVFFNFTSNSISPITLFELGLCLGNGKKVVIVCPDDYWRKGNVVVTAERYGVAVWDTLNGGLGELHRRLENILLVKKYKLVGLWS